MRREILVVFALVGLAGGASLAAAGTPADAAASRAARSAPARRVDRLVASTVPLRADESTADEPVVVSRAPSAEADLANGPTAADPKLYDDSVVRALTITFETDNWLALLEANGCRRGAGGPGQPGQPTTPTVMKDVTATLEVDGTRLEQVGVRCKGNSSLGITGNKKPLNVTLDAFKPGQTLWGFDVFNLDNNWNDPSQLRSALGLRLLADYMPVPRFTFARVAINGKVVGLYSLVEQMDSVWANHFFGEKGLIIRGDSPVRIAFNSSTLNWKGEDLTTYKQNYEVKGKAASSDDGYVRLRELIRTLDAPEAEGGPAEADFPEAIRRALNVDSALWYLAGTSILAHYDSYYVGKNYYMYVGERDSRFNIINWDLGLAFGTFGFNSGGGGPGGGGPGGGTATNPALVDPFAQETAANRPLIRRLLAVPEYRADYLAHYRTLLYDVFTEDWMGEVGQSYQDLIKGAVQAEVDAQGKVSGSYTYEQFISNLRDPISGGGAGGGRPGGGGGFSNPGILAIARDRRAYLLGRPDMLRPDLSVAQQSLAPAAPKSGEAIAVRVTLAGSDAATTTGVELRYRVAGGFEEILPMQADGRAWTATIPAPRSGRRVTYGFRIALADGRAHFLPEANWTHPYHFDIATTALPTAPTGDLVLNELMADNTTTIKDEVGEYEDWLELYNRGQAPVNLGGYYLSDNADDPLAFALPDRALAPGEHLLVWCDGNVDQGPLHAPFGLSRQGETVTLARRDAVVDSVTFPSLLPDQSTGREHDGVDKWGLCGRPSPAKPNLCDGSVPTPEPTATATSKPEPRPSPTAPGKQRALYVPWAER